MRPGTAFWSSTWRLFLNEATQVPLDEPGDPSAVRRGYGDAVIRYYETLAGGVEGFESFAALEACVGLYARAFASATVKGNPVVVEAVTPRFLSLVARELFTRGESVHEIQVDGGRLRLVPSAWFYVHGEADRERWTYELTAAGPSQTATRKNVPASGVIHCMYAFFSTTPWIGARP